MEKHGVNEQHIRRGLAFMMDMPPTTTLTRLFNARVLPILKLIGYVMRAHTRHLEVRNHHAGGTGCVKCHQVVRTVLSGLKG